MQELELAVQMRAARAGEPEPGRNLLQVLTRTAEQLAAGGMADVLHCRSTAFETTHSACISLGCRLRSELLITKPSLDAPPPV